MSCDSAGRKCGCPASPGAERLQGRRAHGAGSLSRLPHISSCVSFFIVVTMSMKLAVRILLPFALVCTSACSSSSAPDARQTEKYLDAIEQRAEAMKEQEKAFRKESQKKR